MKSDKDRTIAIVLAFFLGGLGVHKFYIGKTGQGLVFLLFCWTLIPALLGLIDAVRYLGMSDAEFQQNAVTNGSGATANSGKMVQRAEPKAPKRSEPKMVKKFRDSRLGGSEEIVDFMPAHVGELMGSGDDKQINGTLMKLANTATTTTERIRIG